MNFGDGSAALEESAVEPAVRERDRTLQRGAPLKGVAAEIVAVIAQHKRSQRGAVFEHLVSERPDIGFAQVDLRQGGAVFKAVHTQIVQPAAESHACERRAVFERLVSESSHAVGKFDSGQSRATVERLLAEFAAIAFRQLNACKFCAVHEQSVTGQILNRIRNHNVFHARVCEHIRGNCRQSVGKQDVLQCGATAEQRRSDLQFNAPRAEVNRLQRRAILKYGIAQSRAGYGNHNVVKFCAPHERLASDLGHRRRDGHAFQKHTVFEASRRNRFDVVGNRNVLQARAGKRTGGQFKHRARHFVNLGGHVGRVEEDRAHIGVVKHACRVNHKAVVSCGKTEVGQPQTVGERVAAHTHHAGGNQNLPDLSAVAERVRADVFNALRHLHGFQIRAVRKRFIADVGYGCGDHDFRQIHASAKRRRADGVQSCGKCHGGQSASFKDALADGGNAVRQGHRAERRCTAERRLAEFGQNRVAGEGCARKRRASVKRVVAECADRCGNRNRFERRAPLESAVVDGFQSFGKQNGFQLLAPFKEAGAFAGIR